MVRQRLSTGNTPHRLSFGNASESTMARKRKATATSPDEDTPAGNAPKTSAVRKRKINWAKMNDSNFGGFEVHTATIRPSGKQSNKKQKVDAQADSDAPDDATTDADITQSNPFTEVDLSATYHVIKPVAEWESTKRYKNFTLAGEVFQAGQNVWVKTANKHNADGASTLEVARILEVRAGDGAHVYLRIYWMYRPEELPGGREAHHGECELVASNHMDVIEATNVEDIADVVYWDDNNGPLERPEEDRHFFRQTYDIIKSKGKQLSELKTYCIDKEPLNPDESLIYCPSCSIWLHSHCIEEQAVRDACKEHQVEGPQKKSRGRSKKGRKSSSMSTFTAEISTLKSGKTRLTLTDKRPDQDNRRWNADVKCLACKTIIEDAVEGEGAEEVDEEKDDVSEIHGDDHGHTIVVDTKSKATETSGSTDDDEEDEDEDKDEQEASDDELGADENPHDAPPSGTASPSPKAKQANPKAMRASDAVSSVTDTAPAPNAQKRKRKRAASASNVPDPTTTPVTTHADGSVFQSGIRSVKRLLWSTT
ncbi:hypothetical protein P153DRAFT_393728 [Dothidotthia symphoricarpi CBS 119687]|uniref:BAH domain-containing protein n=1 Tax=Dothidotthia symphoricarpi CBS 119687 TaxID=1392245 RepID=A0A6A6ALT7_9PLEO|nr:uncharacterized protein P153DRAFT_393728 [Dothidotthia symphoricarpi CBS 119687]KAF2132770.1 hypothetical protein P153DRAFT_393728 [Dothidotthia symphoricarpi CBS 119687]